MYTNKKEISIRIKTKSVSNRNSQIIPILSKRANSLKPIINKVYTVPTKLPITIKCINEPQKKLQNTFKLRSKQCNKGFDDQILWNKNEGVRRKVLNKQGLSKDELAQRKQSHLNACFNVRKNRLKQITSENKRIYVKINSQKSLYSSRQLNKSYESNSSISRRLSQSKLSRSSSKQSMKMRQSGRKKQQKLKHQQIKIQSHNINNVQNNQVYRYLNIFCNHINLQTKPIQKNIGKQSFTFDFKKDKENKIPGIKLQKIIQQFDLRPRRRVGNVMLAKIL